MTDPDDTAAWDARCYDDAHAFVYEYGEDLIQLLAPAATEWILDLGCGTGHLTRRIADEGATVLGIDSSWDMVTAARAEYPTLPICCADARTVGFRCVFDAVFSNAMLHWVPEDDQDAVLATVTDALRPGGRFVAELGGTGNVATITEVLLDELEARGYHPSLPWYFPTVGEYACRLERHGFEVRSARLFDRPTDLDGGAAGLRNWIEMFGDTLIGPLPADERAAVLGAVEDRLRGELFNDGCWVADYRRLRVVAYRPES